MASKAQIKANNKYNKKAYYRPNVIFKKEYEEVVRARAAEQGLSLSAYLFGLVKKDLEENNCY